MNIKQLLEDYKEAFGEKAALPIAFWHSDMPVADPEPVNGCFFPVFEKVREGQAVSFDRRDTCLFNGAAWPKVKDRIP